MSNRPLDITKRQARVLIEAADEANGVVEVKMGNTFVRLIPAKLVKESKRLDQEQSSEQNKGPKKWS